MFISSSISSSLEFLSVSDSSIYENYESKVFKNKKNWLKYLINGQMI